MIKFGTSGYRGTFGDNFTKVEVQKICQALATRIKKEKSKKPVVIGYDRRFMGRHIAIWAAEVFAGNKITCKLYTQPVATPTVMFTVMDECLDYGVMITASHNPYHHNGIKLVIEGGRDASQEVTADIEKNANKNIKIKALDYDDGVKNNLMGAFLPGISQVIDGFSELMIGSETAGETIMEGVQKIADTIKQSIPRLRAR